MGYELFVRRCDVHSERIMKLLLDRGLPFAEVQLNESDADALELVAGKCLPFVKRGDRVIGGFSDVSNDLRRPVRHPQRVLRAG